MRLTVTPQDGLVDEVTAIRVDDVSPGTEVVVSVEIVDAAGHPWRSKATFNADPTGAVDTSTMAPRDGTWSGVDPAGPWWSMAFTDESTAPTAFVACDGALQATVVANAEGWLAKTLTWRCWRRPGVTVNQMAGAGFTLTAYLPAGGAPAPGVLLVPGSTGAGAMTPMAALLASRGYAAAVVGYMEGEGLPPNLQDIPVEVITAAAAAFAEHPSCAPGPLAVLAASVGTEGALSALAHLDGFDARATVGIAPSLVVWQALADGGQPPKTSSWSLAGQPLPWVPMRGEKLMGQVVRHHLTGHFSRHPRTAALQLLPAYAAGLEDAATVAEATIPVERIAGPLLLIAGGDDAMWPSATMAEALATRRHQAGADGGDDVIVFDHAGHR